MVLSRQFVGIQRLQFLELACFQREAQVAIRTEHPIFQLMALPGTTAAEADRVIAERPYEDAGELVTRGILPKHKYDKMADRLTVNIWRAELARLDCRGTVPV